MLDLAALLEEGEAYPIALSEQGSVAYVWKTRKSYQAAEKRWERSRGGGITERWRYCIKATGWPQRCSVSSFLSKHVKGLNTTY